MHNIELIPTRKTTKLLKLLNIDNHRNDTIPNAIDTGIEDFRKEVGTTFKDIKVKEPKQESVLKEIKLVNDKSNDITQALLAKYYDLCCQFSSEYETMDREMMKIKMYYYELKECIKNKEKEWIKEKETHKEIDQYNEESSISSTSLTVSEYQLLHQRHEQE